MLVLDGSSMMSATYPIQIRTSDLATASGLKAEIWILHNNSSSWNWIQKPS